ncbi:MAG: response regulator transcription factor [Oligoflexus sp.]|nr:response regulator transcription factor [Oligoflexus sp.]
MPTIAGQYTITLDDDPIVHKIIAQATGVPSIPFTCPQKLLRKSLSLSPIAVFLDINLKENVSGLDCLPELRGLWRMAPILVMTGDRNNALIGRSLASGANDFLRKPINPDELIARMKIRICEMQEKRGFDEIKLADTVFNPRLGTLAKGDRVVYLPRLEAEILLHLSNGNGVTFTKESIRLRLWGKTKVCDNAIDKKLTTLRKAFRELNSSMALRTVYGGQVSLAMSNEIFMSTAN